MFANTYKYKLADSKKWCDKHGCAAAADSVDCNYSGHTSPTGYTYSDYCGSSCGCYGATYRDIYVRNPKSTYWNPLPTKMGDDVSDWSESDTNAAFSCCTNSEFSSAGKSNCGTFLWEGSGPKSSDCAAVLNKFCKYGDNILKPECKAIITKTPDLQAILKTKCPNKKDDGDWDEVCACYYGYPEYDKLAKIVEKEWEGPEGEISRIPECIDPKCAASDYRNDTTLREGCPDVSFSKCVQNANFNISDSTIGNVKFKSECTIGQKKWEKHKKPGDSKNTSAKNTGDKNNDDTEPSNGMDDTTKIILTIIVILLVSLGLYLVVADDDDDDDQMMFMGDQYQSETYGSYY